jgi:hypothetical protein
MLEFPDKKLIAEKCWHSFSIKSCGYTSLEIASLVADRRKEKDKFHPRLRTLYLAPGLTTRFLNDKLGVLSYSLCKKPGFLGLVENAAFR